MDALHIARLVARIIDAGRGDELAYIIARDTADIPAPALSVGQQILSHEIARRIPTALVSSADERRRLAEQVVIERDGENRYSIALDIVTRMASEVDQR